MEKPAGRVLMITPFGGVQRGNSLTAARIQAGLITRGFPIDLLSLQDHDWQGRLQSVLDQSIYSMVHGFHALHFGLVMRSVPAIRHRPLLLTTTGTDLHYDLWGPNKTTVLEAMQAVHKIVLFNDRFRTTLSAALPELGEKFITIPQGVSMVPSCKKTRQDLGLAADEFIFLLPSGLRAVKNIEMAIDALAVLHDEYASIRLLIIGAVIEEEYSRIIMERIRSLPWITYLGEVPHNQMAAILGLGDAVLNTSHSEGQPQAALEAMSLGKPCILTAVDGNLNLIEEGKEGFYVNSRTELIDAARTLLTYPGLREEMGNKARQLIEARFTLEQELDAYDRLYGETLGINPI